MLFVVLSASSGDLFYYSYPPVCGQISRLKAAAKHHSDFEPSVSKQTRDFSRHWLLLSGCMGSTSQCSYWNRDDLMIYFCHQWSNVLQTTLFVGGLLISIVDKKNIPMPIAVIGWCDSWRPRDDEGYEMLSPWPPLLYATDPIRSHATWIHHHMATLSSNGSSNGSSKRDQKFCFPWA